MLPAVTRGEPRLSSGADLRDALLNASAWLTEQAERVNALNVFPVPDGDTGTNMSLTLAAAAAAIRELPDTATVGQVARTAYEAAMMSARGNSGVILSQLLRGVSSALEGNVSLGASDAAAALEAAAEVAYRGVSRPVEGTILTVARRVGEAAREAAERGEGVPDLMEHVVRAAAAAVAETPSQLEVLRKAGVVDSGGEGYRVLLEGIWMWATGRPLHGSATQPTDIVHADLAALGADEETPFGFCTEFLLRDADVSPEEARGAMEALGESVIAVGDPSLLRVHVHTLRPGRALEYAVDHGTLARVKIENMVLQHQEFAASSGAGQTAATGGDDAEATSTVGVVAVAAGPGMKQVVRSLGATVVEGGQSMNPSVRDLLQAIERAPFQHVILLPNNANIVLTARHAAELTDREVRVVPTLTVPQGISAMLAFNYEADLDENVAAMTEAIGRMHTVEVTRAVRDAEVDGVAVQAGRVMGIFDDRVVAVSNDAISAVLDAMRHARLERLELVTIYWGDGVTEASARDLADQICAEHPGVAVEVVHGGQPHYPYVISLE